MIVELKIPPGVSNNGTLFDNAGRWIWAPGWRWHNGKMSTIIGREDWQNLDGVGDFSSPDDKPLKLIAWRDNSSNRFLVRGTRDKLEVLGDLITPTRVDITPSGLTTGADTDYWQMDTWGQYLVAMFSADGNLYEWQLDYSTPTPAAVISNAPTDNLGLIVTSERFLFALGAGGNPRKVQWCDQGDNTTWSPTQQNQAGSFLLESGKIITAVRGHGETLIFTDTGDVWAARYIGRPLVYSFQRVGSSAPPIGPNAVVSSDAGVFWMGRGSFHYYDGRVRSLPCPVSDAMFFETASGVGAGAIQYPFGLFTNDPNFNTVVYSGMYNQVHAFTMTQYSEVWWFYPTSTDAGETRYVAYNYSEGHWMMGDMGSNDQTNDIVGIDRGAYDYPITTNNFGDVHYHNTDGDSGWVNAAAYSGPILLDRERRPMRVRWFHWDHGPLAAGVTIELKEVDRPAPTTFPSNTAFPFSSERTKATIDASAGNRVATNFLAKWVAIAVSDLGGRTHFGTPSIDVVPCGRR